MQRIWKLPLAAAACVLAAARIVQAQEPSAAALYAANCAACHDAGVPRAPNRAALGAMTPEQILAAMESGPMISMALRMSTVERRTLSEYLAGHALGTSLAMDPPPSALCAPSSTRFELTAPFWQGWGATGGNTRMQSTRAAGIKVAEVPRLAVKWAFGLPGDNRAYAASTVAAGRVFVGSQAGKVYSLDVATGCVHWYFDAGAGVRGAISIAELGSGPAARYAVFFGDQRAMVHALDASTGKPIWSTRVDDFPAARVTGSVALYDGKLYVPVSSGEEATGAAPTYECCRFRGSLVALDVATGRVLWKTYMVDEPKPTKKNAVGTQLWGPSGVPIWSSPAIDPERKAVYVTTGNNYTDPPSALSDAFVALDARNGKILWSRQTTRFDAYTAACRMTDKTNCAAAAGPDFDYGASPILADLGNGRRVLLAGQKSGVVYALDPDNDGKPLWQERVGRGGSMGGVQWGSAADEAKVYVAISDLKRVPVPNTWATDADPSTGGGLVALDLRDGSHVWAAPPVSCADRARCSPAQPGAVSLMPGVVFSGSMDGHVRAYSSADGSILWDFDTVRRYDTVNGVPAEGGALDGAGPTIAGGIVLVNSGYAQGGGKPGNVLIAFSVDGK